MSLTITELKNISANALEQYHAAERQIKILREERKQKCSHKYGFTVRSNSYFEEGRMSGPLYYEEKICKRCGKVLDTRSEQKVMPDWSE